MKSKELIQKLSFIAAELTELCEHVPPCAIVYYDVDMYDNDVVDLELCAQGSLDTAVSEILTAMDIIKHKTDPSAHS